MAGKKSPEVIEKICVEAEDVYKRSVATFLRAAACEQESSGQAMNADLYRVRADECDAEARDAVVQADRWADESCITS